MNEWLVKAVMAMYEGAQTVVRTTEGDSKVFNVKVGLHQGCVLSRLLFVIVMEMVQLTECMKDLMRHPVHLIYVLT